MMPTFELTSMKIVSHILISAAHTISTSSRTIAAITLIRMHSIISVRLEMSIVWITTAAKTTIGTILHDTFHHELFGASEYLNISMKKWEDSKWKSNRCIRLEWSKIVTCGLIFAYCVSRLDPTLQLFRIEHKLRQKPFHFCWPEYECHCLVWSVTLCIKWKCYPNVPSTIGNFITLKEFGYIRFGSIPRQTSKPHNCFILCTSLFTHYALEFIEGSLKHYNWASNHCNWNERSENHSKETNLQCIAFPMFFCEMCAPIGYHHWSLVQYMPLQVVWCYS